MNCWICGEPATKAKLVYNHGEWDMPELTKYRRCYCEKCFKDTIETESRERKLYIKLRKREMFRNACNILEAQHTDMYGYKEAIEVVGDFIEENPDKIDSSYEALTAIVLVKNRIHCKMQYKIGRYQVDFLLPELFVVLEIDGERHKHKKEYDSDRDRDIKRMLGPEWDIIRIATDNIDKDAKRIPKAIDKVLEYRESKRAL